MLPIVGILVELAHTQDGKVKYKGIQVRKCNDHDNSEDEAQARTSAANLRRSQTTYFQALALRARIRQARHFDALNETTQRQDEVYNDEDGDDDEDERRVESRQVRRVVQRRRRRRQI